MADFGGAYVVLLVAFLAWLAGWTAWVPPAPGAAPLPEQRLRQRIGSLADAGLALRVEQPSGQPGQLLVTRDFRDAKRTTAVRLHFDAASHCVRARELSRVRGDRPMNAGEARMSSSLRPRDGTHPDADLIHDASLTVTLPSAAMRHQIGARVTDDRVTIAGDREAATDPANLSHVLTEVVHQSGWGGRACSSIGSAAAADDRPPIHDDCTRNHDRQGERPHRAAQAEGSPVLARPAGPCAHPGSAGRSGALAWHRTWRAAGAAERRARGADLPGHGPGAVGGRLAAPQRAGAARRAAGSDAGGAGAPRDRRRRRHGR